MSQILVFINLPEGQNKLLLIDSNIKTQKFVKMIYQKINLDSQNAKIHFATKILGLQTKNIPIYQFGIVNNSTIFITYELKGGNLEPFQFNNLQQKKQVKFSSKAPKYRTVGQGLNLEGICSKKGCIAEGKKAWAIKGFGDFDMHFEVENTNCPICGQEMTSVINMGFYQAKVQIEGKMHKNNEKIRVNKPFQAKNEKLFLTFEECDGSKATWLYMKVHVKSILQ